MSRRILLTVAGLFLAALLLLALPTGRAVSREMADVFVTNFPGIQEVEGTVEVEGPIKSAELTRIEGIIVSPVKRNDTTRLVEAGTLVTDGYPYVVLSLVGQVKGSVTRAGVVGAILLPEEETVQHAFNEEGRIIFPLEIETSEIGNSPYFHSGQPRMTVGFAKYKVLLYNTSDKTVEVDLFAYLTN